MAVIMFGSILKPPGETELREPKFIISTTTHGGILISIGVFTIPFMIPFGGIAPSFTEGSTDPIGG